MALLAATPARGALIDFETTPSGSSSSNDLVLLSTSPYTFPGLQIFFGFDSNSDGTVDSNAVFEHVGVDPSEPPDGGFSGSTPPMIDTPDASDAPFLGQYFLRSPVSGSDFGKFIITYSSTSPVAAASGEIWDIDGTQVPGDVNPGDTEEYTLTAYDVLNNPTTIVSPLGVLATPYAPLDGKRWIFSFSGITAGIARIEIDFTGSKPAGIGLAFNNFDPTNAAVPEPGSALLVAIGIVATAVMSRLR
jgi:hypothetical protein